MQLGQRYTHQQTCYTNPTSLPPLHKCTIAKVHSIQPSHWEKYSSNLSYLPMTFSLPLMDFIIGMLFLIEWYIMFVPRQPPTNHSHPSNHNSLPYEILTPLLSEFHISHFFFSSLLTFVFQLTQYHSPHLRDIIFKAIGMPFSCQKDRKWLHPHPTYKSLTTSPPMVWNHHCT